MNCSPHSFLLLVVRLSLFDALTTPAIGVYCMPAVNTLVWVLVDTISIDDIS